MTAHECFIAPLHARGSKETFTIDDWEGREEAQREHIGLVEDLEELCIDSDQPDQVIWVRLQLLEGLKLRLQKLLTTYRDAFTWTHVDMPGINLRIITH